MADHELRRLTIAWFSIIAGKWAFLVTTLVIAYAAGGAAAVGLLGLARFLVPTVIAPFAGLPAVRWPPEVVLRTVNATRTAAIALAGVVVGLDLRSSCCSWSSRLRLEPAHSPDHCTWPCSLRSPGRPAS